MNDTKIAQLVLKVIEAARAVTNGSTQNLVPLMDASEALDAALAPPPQADWIVRTWAEIRAGDRVRIASAEADVEGASAQTWVASGATQVRVKLNVREKPYTMAPSGQVEVLSTEVTDASFWTADAVSALREQFPEMKEVKS